MIYTASFKFPDNEPHPSVNAASTWMGGEIQAIQFGDAFAEREKLRDDMEKLRELYRTNSLSAWADDQGTLAKILELP